MTAPFPLSQKPIYLVWYGAEGGIGVTARTDETGQPYIGHYQLDRNGMPCGRPSEYPQSRLTTGLVAGYHQGKAIAVFVDVEITEWGLSLQVNLPPTMSISPRYMFTNWGSKLPPSWMYLRPLVEWMETIQTAYS